VREPRRLQDAAFLLPCLGLILFTPPLLAIFDVPATLAGVPLLLIYCFACWLGLIVAGWRLSVALERASGAQPRPREERARPAAGIR
jgi:hypothetical protein